MYFENVHVFFLRIKKMETSKVDVQKSGDLLVNIFFNFPNVTAFITSSLGLRVYIEAKQSVFSLT